MFALKPLTLACATVLVLAACGQTPYQSPLADSRDDFGYGTGSTTPNPTPTDDGVARPDTAVSPTPASVVGSFALKGKVTDKDSGAAIQGAVVSIGAASVVTSSDGSYAISDIRDTKVYLEVSKSGYAKLTGLEIAFSGTSGTLAKDVTLTADATAVEQPGFKAELTVGEGKFKEISALAVGNGNVYLLGKADGFLFLNYQSLGVYNGSSGTQLKVTRDIGHTFSHLPKTATRLTVVDGLVKAATSSDAYVYSASGDFLRQEAVGSTTFPDGSTVVTDTSRSLQFSIAGAQVKVVSSSKTENYDLPGVADPKQLALDGDKRLWVLDGLTRTARKFKFTP